ncbi:MAG TPA: hypothetical protein VN109_15500 [Devosia sp.]|jgi:hypothetical protein|nr:hypothetical protein [Devosia sp.]
MKTMPAKKKTAKTLQAVLAAVEVDIAGVVAEIAADRRLEQPHSPPHRRTRRVAAHAA